MESNIIEDELNILPKQKIENNKKRRKRGNNEGAIYKRPDGRWCAQIPIGKKADGTLKRKAFYGKTRKEVSDKLLEFQFDLKNGLVVDDNKITLANWLNTWLFQYKRDNIRETTFESYEYLIRVHITPSIGHYLLKDLRPEHVQILYRNKFEGGLSSRTVKYIHIVLKQSLKQAVRNGIVITNVADAAVLPKQTKKEIKVFTEDEQIRIKNYVANDRLGAAYILALGSGIREGELLALRWGNVDLQKGFITIKETLKRVKVFDKSSDKKTKIVFQQPKSRAGIRTIPVPPAVLSVMKLHKTRQTEEKLLAGPVYTDNDFVFATESGQYLEPRNFLRRYYQITKKLGLCGFNFHCFRHTYATRLLENGVSAKVVQSLLGHSDVTLTLNTYGHVLENIKEDAVTKIDFLFK